MKTKTTYIPVELDKVDIQENTEFDLTVTYGNNEDFLFKNINLKYPFKTAGGMLTGLVAGFTGEGSPLPVIIITWVSKSLSAVLKAEFNSKIVALFNALSFVGLFIVMVVTPSLKSLIILLYFILNVFRKPGRKLTPLTNKC